MIRRSLISAAAAIALVVMPTVAMAYDAPGYDTTVSDPTPAVGRAFTLMTRGAAPGAILTLTITSDPAGIGNDAVEIAGTKTMTKTAEADADGTVTWTVTLSAAGTYFLAVTDAAGNLLGDETVTVAGAAAGTAAGTAAGAVTPGLSDTGFDGAGLAVGAVVLIVAGAVAVFFARRRQLAHAGA